MINTKLTEEFKKRYDSLNEQQKRAVDQIEGPVMVIAGPGTGKTQILSARIGKILLETDVSPANILCLTYTDAGTIAMRKRLLSFIGSDAYRVNIHTFHSFCNDIIQENLYLFEKTAMDPISDLEKTQLFKDLIDTFPKGHPLKRYRGDVYFEINNLQSLFSAMKREGWTSEQITKAIDEFISLVENSGEDSPYYKEYKYQKKYKGKEPGTLKPSFEELKERLDKLRAAANEFDRFQQFMRQRNRYDFDDMINWVIKAFEENKNLLANYQERYQYILVDEYQDTSGTQNKLVELLINYWDKPNIFVVGDDDQSIYRFQGANIENMLQFADSYKNDLLTVVLTNNYRSTQPILDVSKSIISRNEERLVKQLEGLSKELISSNTTISHLTHTPIIREYESQRQEMIGITRQIQELLKQGVQPGRIAVIYKENKYGEELTQYFKLLSIPVYSKRQLNILELPLARKIILLLKYLAAEHDTSFGGDEMLFELLHFDWFDIPPIEIAKLSIEVAEKKYNGQRSSLRQLLLERAEEATRDLFGAPVLLEKLKKISNLIEELIGDVPNSTLQQLFDHIIRKAGILALIMESPDKHWLLQILTNLFDFIKEETHRSPLLNLQGLVNLIELMEKENISLPIVEVNGSDKGINLLTAHGSKGLEFEYVLLAGCNASFWEKKRRPNTGYTLPETMFASHPKHKDEEELRRLFYVALTRAEQHLYISYSRFKNDGKELEPSRFIAEIQEYYQLPVEKILLDKEALAEFAALRFGEGEAPEIEKLEETFIQQLLERFSMNVTALNNYLKCPLEFYFKHLVRIPTPKNEATEFGSSVHYALEKLFRKMQDDPREAFPSKQEFIAYFEWYMHRHRESFTREQFNRRIEYGREVLSNYYERHIPYSTKIVTIEKRIKNTVNGIPLKGTLDKLEFVGKQVNVVDYKTGDPDKGLPKLKGPSEKDPNGGDYWRQAVFYKILVDNYESKDWQVVSTEFDFIEPDKKKNYRRGKVVIEPADTTTVLQQIITTWNKIQQHDFYTGCGKPDCHWCEFVKTNNLQVALHEVTEEGEEGHN